MSNSSIPQQVTVTVAGQERRFNLKPFTVRDALDHIEASEKAWNKARASVRDTMTDPLQMTLSSKAYLEAVQPTVVALLDDPADDYGPLTDDDFWRLDSSDPSKVISSQEEFAQLRVVIAGGQLLVDESQREILGEAARASQALLDQIESSES